MSKIIFRKSSKVWTPAAVVAVENPMVFIPARASDSVLWTLMVDGLTYLTKYWSPLPKVPVIVLVGSPAFPIEIESFPLLL